MSNNDNEEIFKKTGLERLQLEFKNIKRKRALTKIGGSAGIINDNYKHWLACFIGPQDTPYENGLFFVEFKIQDDYPAKRPLARFLTRIWHPNVNWKSGNICLSIFDNWTYKNTMKETIESIFNLLTSPYPASPLNADASGDNYKNRAIEERQRYAYQSQEYNCEENDNYKNWTINNVPIIFN